MQRRTLYIILAVVVVLSILAWMYNKNKKKSSGKGFALSMKSSGSFATSEPRGKLWAKFGKTRAPGGTLVPGGTLMPGGTLPPRVASRIAIPTIKPDIVPPFTLGPVPNGITRVPEPPTMQPVGESSLVLDTASGNTFTLYDSPAGAGATIIGGMNVPAVQNPWSVDSWRFLIGSDVSTAVSVVKNLFPSFPVTTRSVKEGPKMSGAVTLVYDEGNKVKQVVRD
jgi:hypothetical protein